jgi:hypothetical protein
MDLIHSVFAIGSYCDADFLLADMYIRGYSSPFSWMFIDLKTALEFIQTGFEGFTGAAAPQGEGRICQWFHHDISDERTVAAIKRRAERLMSRISLPSTLLVYYDKTPNPIEYYTHLLNPFLAAYACKVLVVKQSTATKILYQAESLCIIDSDRLVNTRPLLNYLYMFNIVPIEESCALKEPLIVGETF